MGILDLSGVISKQNQKLKAKTKKVKTAIELSGFDREARKTKPQADLLAHCLIYFHEVKSRLMGTQRSRRFKFSGRNCPLIFSFFFSLKKACYVNGVKNIYAEDVTGWLRDINLKKMFID